MNKGIGSGAFFSFCFFVISGSGFVALFAEDMIPAGLNNECTT
jgi:hypothetical protein